MNCIYILCKCKYDAWVLLDLFLNINNNDYYLISSHRPLSYPDTDVVLMCFAIDNPDSFENVTEKWLPEISHFCPNTPVILVGNKSDLRNDSTAIQNLSNRKMKPVSSEEASITASRMGAHAYMECSARTRDGVQAVFETAARAALSHKNRSNDRKHLCVLL